MEKKINLKIFSSKKNIEIQSLCYGLNLFLPSFILIISSIFKEYVLAAELGILIGINIIFTQIFSANLRSIIITTNNSNNIYSYIIFRLIISTIVMLLNIIIFLLYEFEYPSILIQIAFLILIQWISELLLTFYELQNKISKFFQYFYISLTYIIFILFGFIYEINLSNILFVFNLFFVIFLFLGVKKNNKKTIPLKNIFSTITKSYAFFSSLAISLSNLIWRILIISFCGKILAGIYFSVFAIGSLPGTLFNNSFGPSMIKKNIKIKYLNEFKFLSFLVIFLLSILSFDNRDELFLDNQITQLFGVTISLFGSIFMLKGLYYRQFLIQKTILKTKVFKYDIYYSLIICLIVPILFLFGGTKFIILSFLSSSIASFIIYKTIFIKLKKL